MYSPKIREELIPKLYRLAKARKIPMTKLVNEMIEEALIGEDIPETVEEDEQRNAAMRTLQRKERLFEKILHQVRKESGTA